MKYNLPSVNAKSYISKDVRSQGQDILSGNNRFNAVNVGSTSGSGSTIFIGETASCVGEPYSSAYSREPVQDAERPFVCDLCNRCFKLRHHLTEHSVVHSSEKPYKCPLCPYRSKRSKETRNHVRMKHVGHDVSNMAFDATPMEDKDQGNF